MYTGVRSRLTPTTFGSRLGDDGPTDLAVVVATFGLFFVADRVTRHLAAVEVGDLSRFSIIAAGVGRRWWLSAALGVGAIAMIAGRPARVAIRWDGLEHGRVLRLSSSILILLMTWQHALYPHNWMADRVHWFDRSLVVVLAAAAITRPAFLVPFVAVARIMGEQFVLPFGTTAGRNIDDLLLMALLAVAAAHLLHVLTGTRRTSAVILLVATALTAHFFGPGRGKMAIGWLSDGNIANLPLASYTVGWLGHTDGHWARWLWGFLDAFRWPAMVATLVFELGSIVALAWFRLFRWWLVGSVVFHTFTFATTGFWFGEWIVLEIGLLIVLSATSLRPWVEQNTSPGRAAVAVGAVLAGSLLFHPPGLAWLDAPVSYGYRLDAVGISGERFRVPSSDLAPLSHHIVFDRPQLGPHSPATGPYGVAASGADIDRLATVTSFDELRAVEADLPPPTLVEPSRQFLASFMEYAARPHHSWSERLHRWVAPPEHFWTSRAEPTYGFQEPLQTLEVHRVRSLHLDGRPIRSRQLVLTITVDADGRLTIIEPNG